MNSVKNIHFLIVKLLLLIVFISSGCSNYNILPLNIKESPNMVIDIETYKILIEIFNVNWYNKTDFNIKVIYYAHSSDSIKYIEYSIKPEIDQELGSQFIKMFNNNEKIKNSILEIITNDFYYMETGAISRFKFIVPKKIPKKLINRI